MRVDMSSRFFEYTSVSENERIQLFCFHYAGGSALSYGSLSEFLPDYFSIYPYQLPSRGSRCYDRYPESIIEAACEAALAVRSECRGPFMIMGHSMGGMIGAVTASVLEREYGLIPERLFLTAAVPDFERSSKANGVLMTGLDDDEFCRCLMEFGAIDSRIFRIKRFREDYLPLIRSDFSIAEAFSLRDRISVGISAYGGDSDRIVRPEDIEMWKEISDDVSIKIMSGGHFFIKNNMEEICRDIASAAENSLSIGGI